MVVDSSAIVAIALGENEAQRMAAAISTAPERWMPVHNWLEVMIVVESRLGREASNAARLILEELEIRPFRWIQNNFMSLSMHGGDMAKAVIPPD